MSPTIGGISENWLAYVRDACVLLDGFRSRLALVHHSFQHSYTNMDVVYPEARRARTALLAILERRRQEFPVGRVLAMSDGWNDIYHEYLSICARLSAVRETLRLGVSVLLDDMRSLPTHVTGIRTTENTLRLSEVLPTFDSRIATLSVHSDNIFLTGMLTISTSRAGSRRSGGAS